MRYSADDYLNFLRGLISAIFSEYERIGADLENWQASFEILRPDFKKSPSANAEGEEGSEAKTRAEGTFYSQEEIAKMPRLKDGRFRITPDGYHQVRYRRDGYDIQFTSKNLQTVKDKFRAWCRSVNDARRAELSPGRRKASVRKFGEFAEQYFRCVKAANVEKGTYAIQHRALEMHILPKIGDLELSKITPLVCQELLNGLLIEGKGRTAEMVKCILNEILRAAVGERLIQDNPMDFVKIPRHVRQNGTALSVEEVRRFAIMSETSPYRKQFMIYLYTGIRRNELHSMRIQDDFIIVACGKKRRGQQQKFRKIPIAPGLRPFLPLSEAELDVNNDTLTSHFKKICPRHHLYDLRHTFTTRCQECGIPKALVDLWTGHSDNRDMTASVYTHFSDDFQRKEILKLEF